MPVEPPPDPVPICRDTWLLTQLEPAPPVGSIFFNSAVITARQPVVVDTGTAGNRERWLAQLGSVLDPVDVRWVFLSHDDPDHVGNLSEVLRLCPNATVLTGWFALGRLLIEHGIELPADRVRFLNDGDTIDVGDRVLHAVLPPIFDNPTTRALVDPATGFCWGGDCFAAPVQQRVVEADEAPAADWREGFLYLQRLLSPWHNLLDVRRYGALVDRFERTGTTLAAGAHGPVVRGSRLADAFRMLRELPHLGAPRPFDQGDLDTWLAATAAASPHT